MTRKTHIFLPSAEGALGMPADLRDLYADPVGVLRERDELRAAALVARRALKPWAGRRDRRCAIELLDRALDGRS